MYMYVHECTLYIYMHVSVTDWLIQCVYVLHVYVCAWDILYMYMYVYPQLTGNPSLTQVESQYHIQRWMPHSVRPSSALPSPLMSLPLVRTLVPVTVTARATRSAAQMAADTPALQPSLSLTTSPLKHVPSLRSQSVVSSAVRVTRHAETPISVVRPVVGLSV